MNRHNDTTKKRRHAGWSAGRLVGIPCIIGLLVAAAFHFLWQGRRLATAEFATVTRMAVGDTLQERGWLEAAGLVPVLLRSSGEVREIMAEGTLVSPGDLLVSIDTSGHLKDRLDGNEETLSQSSNRLMVTRYRRNQTEREARQNIIITGDRLKLAEMEYDEIRAGLRPEERRLLEITTELRAIEFEDAQEAFERQSNLVSRGLASPITLEDFERRLAAAAAAHEEAKIEFAVRAAPPREDEVLEARLAVERLRGELERGGRALERRLARMDAEIAEQVARLAEHRLIYDQTHEEYVGGDIYSKTNGIFRPRSFWDNGSRTWGPIRAGVGRGRFDYVGDVILPGVMRVRTMIHEADINRVTTNMPVEIRVPALANKIFTGRVRSLDGIGRDRAEVGLWGVEGNLSGVTVFSATITLDQNDERFRAYMSARVGIECLPVAERLVLPREAVGDYRATDATGRVRLENNETREVTGRYIAGAWFWVEDGLMEGERVRRVYE